ncbi:MAG: hypothetical protein R3F14_29005 [Polyangiaceae bacterium]
MEAANFEGSDRRAHVRGGVVARTEVRGDLSRGGDGAHGHDRDGDERAGDLVGQDAALLRGLGARAGDDLLQSSAALLGVAAEDDEVLGVVDVATFEGSERALHLHELGERGLLHLRGALAARSAVGS